MKRLIFFVVFIMLFLFKTQAQNCLISFAAKGDTTIVNTVKVENLSSSDTVTLNGDDVLHLAPYVGIGKLDKTEKTIQLYPNPMEGQAFLSFFAPANGDALIQVVELSGKTVYQMSKLLSPGTHSYHISNIRQGIYLLKVTGENYHYTIKLISLNNQPGRSSIEYVSSIRTVGQLKQTGSVIDMPYKTGDRLLFKGISGRYSTIVTDVPLGSKTIAFNFVLCTDADNNNYSTVTIGNQVWMAENLKTTKFNEGTSIPEVTGPSAWGALSTPRFCWYDNNITNKNPYGAIYNWYVVNTTKLAPAGWHVPTDAEWKQLEMALGMTQAETDVRGWRGSNQGTKLKNISGWNISGNGTNASGFTALPGGARSHYGKFYDLGFWGYWWSATEHDTSLAWYRILYCTTTNVYRNYNGIETYGFSVRCVSDKSANAFVLVTASISNITQSSATGGGNILSDGGSSVSARGVCWNTSSYPTTSNSKTNDGTGTGSFTSNLTGLVSNSLYYARAYATNSDGTVYGDEFVFKTLPAPGDTVSDIDGNLYTTVTIGTQVWMTENLKTTTFNDGSPIPFITSNPMWEALSTPGYCWYNNESSNKNSYGALYNWYSVNTGKLAPAGWHVPSDDEWTTLVNFLGGDSIAGGKLKEAGLSHWLLPNTGATNESRFSALPGGMHGYGMTNLKDDGIWWSSTACDTIPFPNAWTRAMRYNYADVVRWKPQQFMGCSVRCLKGDVGTSVVPKVTTIAITNIKSFTATGGGIVISDGGASVSTRGVCWSNLQYPSISSENKTTNGSGIGSFTSSLTGLKANTQYHIRAYATNSKGTAYGNQLTFTTDTDTAIIFNPDHTYDSLIDIEGNVYKTIKIGTQTWMAENLKTTKYNDGTPIPLVTIATEWAMLSTPAYCWYNNDIGYKKLYGALYDWYAVNTRKLAPAGWHVPSEAEWITLLTYLGGTNVAGGKLKEKGTVHWDGPNTGATNESGFSALPGGIHNFDGHFLHLGFGGFWWSTTEYDNKNAWRRELICVFENIGLNFHDKSNGLSVRCVKD